MNDVLRLRGNFFSRKSPNAPGAPSLLASADVTSAHLRRLSKQLEGINASWTSEYATSKPLVSVYYTRVISKSGRTRRVLAESGANADRTVVGSKFEDGPNGKRHVVTHCISGEALARSILVLQQSADILDEVFGSHINCQTLKQVNGTDEAKRRYGKQLEPFGITRVQFAQVIVDVSLVEKYGITTIKHCETDGPSIVTVYDTGEPLARILDTLGIPYHPGSQIDSTSLIMSKAEFELLADKAPYLIAMSVPDTISWTTRKPNGPLLARGHLTIPPPTNEPVVGVIDTLFCGEEVYFSDWVEHVDLVDKNIPRDSASFDHGTMVSSIIVDGPTLNPWLDDGCGRFRVKHFGVANGKTASLYTLRRIIPEIIKQNKSIKVWNLCLGSTLPTSENAISPIGALLDDLQRELDIVFVVAGTNDFSAAAETTMRLGSPADSVNSIVVNSVREDGSPASYSRSGPVLSFYGKPDVCYLGGDVDEPLAAYGPNGLDEALGTSFAAPWIARKLAYLIHVIGLPREAAKALIIDSAAGWKRETNAALRGYGQVPKRIESILQTQEDEIKFIVTGKSTMYDTYTYRIPVPVNKGKQPYYAKATLCYFPECSREQGVDYTKTELDLRIGRLNGRVIKAIDNNMQGEPGVITYEGDARKYFRKWDNVKIIGEEIKERRVPRMVYESEYWGISLKAKERFNFGPNRSEVSFGLVVTLKEMYGVNRFDEFIRRCEFAQWRVTRLDANVSMDIYNAADEEIEFED